MNVVPPDVGAVHQVNLEYLSRVIQVSDGFIYPDSVVGTDSHTTMINGLGILGWGKPFLNCFYHLLTFWSSCTWTVIYNHVFLFRGWGNKKYFSLFLENVFKFPFFSLWFFSPPGVGGIESEAVMLGQPVSLTLPQVVGCKLVGSINPLTTSIDVVLGITKVTLLCFASCLIMTIFLITHVPVRHSRI